MNRDLRIWIALLMAGGPLWFQGCDSEEPAAPPQPVSALYQCRGTPGYAGTWDEILKGLDSSGVTYCAPPPVSADTFAEPARVISECPIRLADPLDTVKLHIVLLDGQCRFLETQENILVWPKGAEAPFWFWDGKMADGSAAPTGEYYINLVREWRDGSKDTSWSKSGYIRTQCGGPLRVP